ncbi:(Fe-S)-binding protein [Caldalkalibacillus salinus]|uniref:(Fe-S)-binding protein n=1 Tax=Caldalkalibacillus salinus TaxID=2803787 RepID=UPI0019239CE3|nr:(Fe-S)-binding protein [Caldalkalibacillus salinus]
MNNKTHTETGHTSLAYEETFDCVQCGYCLPACPTYQTMRKETHSPRGRINLVKMAAEGKVSLSQLQEPIDLCLGCRACETACPTNVQYGTILNSAKEAIQKEKNKSMGGMTKWLSHAMFKQVLPNATAMGVLRTGLYAYQRLGIQSLARQTGLLPKMLPESLATFERITPQVDTGSSPAKRPKKLHPKGKRAYKVGFFTGCIMDTVFTQINTLSMKLLQQAGCEVEVIHEQTCCGALQHHSGEGEQAKALAKRNIEAFESYDFDYIVNSIGGCGAALVEYDELLKDESEWCERAKAFVDKNVDISVILGQLRLPFKKRINKTVTYQPSCHMSNVQKRVQEPLQLLQSIPGIQYQEMPEKEMCCGSAGIYNLIHYEAAMDILDEKMKNVQQCTPNIIVTTNPGCHLQMTLGVERDDKSKDIQVVHLVELLAEACDLH